MSCVKGKVVCEFPVTYFTVDIAAIARPKSTIQLLLGRKSSDKGLRFPGGFVDINDASLEDAASRELMEETELEMDPGRMKYLGSVPIKDARYANPMERIMTGFFLADFTYDRFGQESEAADDLDFVDWFNITESLRKLIAPNHRVLYDLLHRELMNRRII